jgi:hypothetical protein
MIFSFQQGHIFMFVSSTQTGCGSHPAFYLEFILFSFSQPWEVLKYEWNYNSSPPVAFLVYTWITLPLHLSEIHKILKRFLVIPITNLSYTHSMSQLICGQLLTSTYQPLQCHVIQIRHLWFCDGLKTTKALKNYLTSGFPFCQEIYCKEKETVRT